MTVRVGVTGHRDLADPPAVRQRCIDALRRIRRADEATEIWSSLAEGADRLVAELVPTIADTLVVVLPLEPGDYRRDFTTDASRRQFDEFMAGAARVVVTGADAGGSRESAYERAGLAIVEGCDVLLALWDGQPARGRGGTADIVGEAHERARPVMHIPFVRQVAP